MNKSIHSQFTFIRTAMIPKWIAMYSMCESTRCLQSTIDWNVDILLEGQRRSEKTSANACAISEWFQVLVAQWNVRLTHWIHNTFRWFNAANSYHCIRSRKFLQYLFIAIICQTFENFKRSDVTRRTRLVKPVMMGMIWHTEQPITVCIGTKSAFLRP